MRQHLLAALVATSALLALSPEALAQSPKPETNTTKGYAPRAWPIVVGSLIFAPTYGATVYWAVSGDATSYGYVPAGQTQGEHDFGKPAFLFIPVFGPLLFQGSFCSDATEYYRDHPSGDEPHDACNGNFWQLDFAVQLLGSAFIAGGFLFPVRRAAPPAATISLAPFVHPNTAGLAASGWF